MISTYQFHISQSFRLQLSRCSQIIVFFETELRYETKIKFLDFICILMKRLLQCKYFK